MTVEVKQLVLDSTYLDDYRVAIRSKSLPWEGFTRSGLISPLDSTVLTELEKLSIDGNKKTLGDEELLKFVNTVISVLGDSALPVERNDVLKFNLVVLSDLFTHEGFLQVIISNGLIDKVLTVLDRHIKNEDEIIKLLSIYDSIWLLINNGKVAADDVIDELLNLIQSRNFNLKFLAINLISELLLNSNKSFRSSFWKKHELLFPVLFKNLSASGEDRNITTNDLIQLRYKTLLIIWILSFDKSELSKFSQSYLQDLLLLLDVLKISIKEKIIRLIISIFINLTNALSETNDTSLEIVKFLILNGDFITILKNLKERKWSDDELIQDLDTLLETSLEIFDKLTSFDEYLQELHLKHFKNSPVHHKEEFFIDNLSKFQDSNYKIFYQLLDILDDQHQESDSLKILLTDLEKLLKIDSNALSILSKSPKKAQIMNLLNHKNSEVRYQALKITQLLVSQSLK